MVAEFDGPNQHLWSQLSYLDSYDMVSSPPQVYGGEIFLDPNYLGVICFNFFPPGGESKLGGDKNYLGGISS